MSSEWIPMVWFRSVGYNPEFLTLIVCPKVSPYLNKSVSPQFSPWTIDQPLIITCKLICLQRILICWSWLSKISISSNNTSNNMYVCFWFEPIRRNWAFLITAPTWFTFAGNTKCTFHFSLMQSALFSVYADLYILQWLARDLTRRLLRAEQIFTLSESHAKFWRIYVILFICLFCS